MSRVTATRRERFRDLVVDANDGIVTVAGVVEGIVAAQLGYRALAAAVWAAAAAGAVSRGGSRYSEVSVRRDARARMVEEVQRRLDLSPEAELEELTAIYVDKGLGDDLARAVADRLSQSDALAAHAEADFGIEMDAPQESAAVAAVASGVAFALGTLVVAAIAMLTPVSQRGLTTFVAVSISLALTSWVVARWGDVPLGRTVARTVTVGVVAMSLAFSLGSLFD